MKLLSPASTLASIKSSLSRDQTLGIFRVNIKKFGDIELEKEKQLKAGSLEYHKLVIKAKIIVKRAGD